jgi:hypothetical protein
MLKNVKWINLADEMCRKFSYYGNDEHTTLFHNYKKLFWTAYNRRQHRFRDLTHSVGVYELNTRIINDRLRTTFTASFLAT